MGRRQAPSTTGNERQQQPRQGPGHITHWHVVVLALLSARHAPIGFWSCVFGGLGEARHPSDLALCVFLVLSPSLS